MTDEVMTYEEFLLRLRQVPRNWVLFDGDRPSQIRILGLGGFPSLCPGLAIGIFQGCPFRWEVAKAADNAKNCDPKIRQDLLEACGLVEP